MPETESTPEDARALLEIVRGVITELSDGRGRGRLDLDVSLERELGLGSLERVELAGRIERAFSRQLPQEAIASADTPRELLALVRAAGGEAGPRDAGPRGRAALPTEAPAPAPASATTLVEVLEYHARAQPERVHVLLREEDGAEDPVRYGELHHEALSVAAGLRARGLSPGDRVAIMLPTGRGYFAAFLGALVAGGVPVPLYPPFRLDRIAEYVARAARILDDAQARYLVTFERVARVADITRDRAPSVEEVISIARLVAHPSAPATVRVAAGDTALIQYTSGSTGDPKGVELTHANVLSNIRAAASGVALAAGDVVVSWLPLYHDMGLIGGWLMNLYFGTPVVLMSPLTFLTRPERWLQVLDEYRATRSVAPNFAFDLCVKRIPPEVIAGLELRQVKSLLNGSEPILPETLDRFVEHCAPAGLRREALFCAYGLAENMVAVTFPPVLRAPRVDAIVRSVFEETGRAEPAGDDVPEGEALRFVGVGSPVAEHEVRIVDDADAPVPERQQGRLHFRGPSTFKGYFRNPAATAAVKRDGGWVDSGDLAYMADGEVFITGRVKDVIIKGGRNYYPHELEAAAAAVPGIRQGCVAAFAERASGAATESIIVVAETRERDAARREALERRVIEAITDAVGVPPDRVVLAEPGAVPKTSSGKIRRAEARARWRSGALDEGHGSFARQAAGLYLGSAPRRLRSLVSGAGKTLFGVRAIAAFGATLGVGAVVGRLTPAGAPLRRAAARHARAALRIAGLRPRVTGLARIPEGAAILIANHASYLDPIVCQATLPVDTRFAVKGELRDNPVLGPLVPKAGHVLIDRHAALRSLADLEELSRLLADGARVLLFPEGTFTPEVGMRPFKLGAFRLACETGVPVVPIALRGTRSAWRDGTRLPRRARIEVEVLEPITPIGRDLADIVDLRDRVAAVIAAHLDEPRLYAADITVPGGRSRDAG